MEFVIARNPDLASSLPFLIRLPLGREGVTLKVRDTWPRTAEVQERLSEATVTNREGSPTA